MSLVLKSPCKINLLLNVLGQRKDGFHDIESIMQPLSLHDVLQIESAGKCIELTCSDPRLSVGGDNLVHRAASEFLKLTDSGGVRIHLQKNLPLAAGIGAGSSNAATTLLGLNELFNHPLNSREIHALAACLGSDVPFFLQGGPALVMGRGDRVEILKPFGVLEGCGMLLVHPGFGVSTPWAYQRLTDISEPFGTRGLAKRMIESMIEGKLGGLCNSLERVVFPKYAVLPIIKEFFTVKGALVTLMSGSGSTIFAITENRASAESLRMEYHDQFGQAGWSATVVL
jgi:4-diphosphocytidyl-2-C-methyl-D-erythritol kinase